MSQLPIREIVAIIPAKGRSTGVPGKNKRLMHGKPLYQWSVEQARRSRLIDFTCVSSDDDEILNQTSLLKAWPIKRPPELCQDDSTTESVIEHAITELAGDERTLVVILPPTNPCRTKEEIDKGIATLLREDWDSCLSVVPYHRFLWHGRNGTGPKSLNYDWQHRPNRQELTPQFMENGCIYISRYYPGFPNRLHGQTGLLPMDYWSSFEIDSEDDWQLVSFAMLQKGLVKSAV